MYVLSWKAKNLAFILKEMFFMTVSGIVVSSCDEIIDVVNQYDHVIGQCTRAQAYADRTNYFRVINAFIKNDQGQLWIPRRTNTKKLFPRCLDVSVGGHVLAGETYDRAFVRETAEEVRIDVVSCAYKRVAYLTPVEHGVSGFMYVYEIIVNESPQYNTNDFSEYYWLHPHEILERLASGDQGKGDLPLIVKALYQGSI